MDVYLLGAGAIVLIGITLWIVWSARDADSGADATVRGEEVLNKTMTQIDQPQPSMPPQGATFEDQYTSATADLSAGGVATAFESMQGDAATPVTPYPARTMQPPHSGQPAQPPVAASTRADPWPQAPAAGERIGQASQSDRFPDGIPGAEDSGLARPKALGVGAGAALSIGGALGGAWLYARWQRERNKPINRLRRGARSFASHLPDVVDDLPPGAGPLGGLATAVLLSGLMVSRALRRDSGDRTDELRAQASDIVRASLQEALGRGREAMDRGRDALDAGREQSKRLPVDRFASRMEGFEPRKPAVMGLGFGGLAVMAGAMFMVWRLLRGVGRKPPTQKTW